MESKFYVKAINLLEKKVAWLIYDDRGTSWIVKRFG